MKPKYLTSILLAMCISGLASAGDFQPRPVEIELDSDDSGNARGSMTSARFSDNDEEYIGCGVRLWSQPDGTYFNWGFCQAKDADGEQVFCETEDSEMLDIMKATGDYSYITFEWDTDGNCIGIGFSTQSFYIPEHTSNKKGSKGPENN